MDVSDLRKRILRALDDARRDASERRAANDEAAAAYATFLDAIATPLFRQAAQVLRAEGQRFSVETPAGALRLTSDHTPQAFVELELDRSGAQPAVIGRVSVPRNREGLVVEETAIGDGKPVAALTEDDVTRFVLASIPRLVVKS